MKNIPLSIVAFHDNVFKPISNKRNEQFYDNGGVVDRGVAIAYGKRKAQFDRMCTAHGLDMIEVWFYLANR